MENSTPQGQPRRQPTTTGPNVAVAHVDPCVVYLEATESDEVPALIMCWARSSSEVQKVGMKSHLKLNRVHVLKGFRLQIHEGCAKQDDKTPWHFVVHEEHELVVKSDAAGAENGFSICNHFQNTIARGFRGEIKFIDQATDFSLEKLTADKMPTDHALIKRILEIASVEWPSLSNALAFLQQKQPSDAGRRSNTGLRRSHAKGELIIYNLGEALYKTGDYKRATETLQLSLKHPGVRYQALNLMGLSFMKRGMPDFAVKQLALAESELPAMDELKKEIVYNLGLAYEASKHPDKALEQWKKIFEVDMSFRDVSKRVEESYGGRDEEAA